MDIKVRPEQQGDYRQVEEITRQAFSYPGRVERGGIGCPYEHWMVHQLRRRDGAGISLVAEADGRLVGHIICSQARVARPDGGQLPVLNFGPLSVLPAYQRQGVGKALMRAMIERARQRGHGAILFFGRPEYYPQFGFVEASRFGVTDREGQAYPAFQAMELKEGYLSGAQGGRFLESDIYDEERNRTAVKEFDRQFQSGGNTVEQIYQATALEPGFWSIEEGGVRCFLVEGPDRAMLVDTGFGKGDLKAFVQTLTRLPVFVVNTHADRDHTGCNALFGAASMHPAEFDRYHTGGGSGELSPLWEGQRIELGQRRFEVILIPGHTPGSIALLDRGSGALLSGDSVQAGPVFLFGPGRDLDAYCLSLCKLQQIKGQVRRVLPSHGELPLDPAILDEQLAGAQALRAGKLDGVPAPNFPDCRVYRHLRAAFLYAN